MHNKGLVTTLTMLSFQNKALSFFLFSLVDLLMNSPKFKSPCYVSPLSHMI